LNTNVGAERLQDTPRLALQHLAAFGQRHRIEIACSATSG